MIPRWQIWRSDESNRVGRCLLQGDRCPSVEALSDLIMKTSLAFCGAALLLAAINSQAAILTGPITNPANGHDYYLLSAGIWTASEAEAEDLGGTLATIRNAG